MTHFLRKEHSYIRFHIHVYLVSMGQLILNAPYLVIDTMCFPHMRIRSSIVWRQLRSQVTRSFLLWAPDCMAKYTCGVRLQHLVKWLWERVWDFSALGSLTSSVSRRVVKLTVSRYYSAPLPLQKRGYGDEIRNPVVFMIPSTGSGLVSFPSCHALRAK